MVSPGFKGHVGVFHVDDGKKGREASRQKEWLRRMTAAPFQEPEQAKGMRARTLGTDFLLQSLRQYTLGKDSQVRPPWARIPLSPHSENLDRPLSPHPPSVKCRRQHFFLLDYIQIKICCL